MSEHVVTIAWHLPPEGSFEDDRFDRSHDWTFPGGEVIQASAAPEYHGVVTKVNPDDAVIAAASSSHMLAFLSNAARRHLKVLSYIDRPVGILDENAEGLAAITRIVLRPRVVFDEDPDAEVLGELHESAHRDCFIANSLRSEIEIETGE